MLADYYCSNTSRLESRFGKSWIEDCCEDATDVEVSQGECGRAAYVLTSTEELASRDSSTLPFEFQEIAKTVMSASQNLIPVGLPS